MCVPKTSSALIGISQAVLEMGEVQATACRLGLEVTPLEIRRAEDIAPAFETHKTQGVAQADALYVVTTARLDANRTRIIALALALAAQLPTIFNICYFVPS